MGDGGKEDGGRQQPWLGRLSPQNGRAGGEFFIYRFVITNASLDMKKGQLYCNYFLRKIQISRFLQEVEGKLREDKIKALVRESTSQR